MGIETILAAVIGTAVSAAMTPKAPKVAATNPAAERAKAENDASVSANAKAYAAKQAARGAGSVLGSGKTGEQAQTTSVLAYGKPTLGA